MLCKSKFCALSVVEGETIIAWTQTSHAWTRIRGIYGDPSRWIQTGPKAYVASAPARDQKYYALAHDNARSYLYWSDMKRRTIYRQPVNSSLFDRRIDDIETIYSGRSNQITAMTVDWLSGSVYFTDDTYNRIIVTTLSTTGQKHIHKILFSTNIDKPKGIAVMPDWA